MKLGYVILYVPLVADAVLFYEAAFGLTCGFAHEGGDYAEMDTGQTRLAFVSETLAASHGFDFRKTNRIDTPPSVEIGLVTDDVQAAYERALNFGATASMQPTLQPWGQTICYVRDNNGYLIELCSPVPSAS